MWDGLRKFPARLRRSLLFCLEFVIVILVSFSYQILLPEELRRDMAAVLTCYDKLNNAYVGMGRAQLWVVPGGLHNAAKGFWEEWASQFRSHDGMGHARQT
jgi:hypothetical protein